MFDDGSRNILARNMVQDQYPQLLPKRRIMRHDVKFKEGSIARNPRTPYDTDSHFSAHEKSVGVLKALADAVLFRHYRILYERKVRARGNDPTIPNNIPKLLLSLHGQLPNTPKYAHNAVQSLEIALASSEVTNTETLRYPSPPSFRLGEKKAKCPVCHRILGVDTFKGDKWM